MQAMYPRQQENYILGNLFRHLREGARLAEAVGLLSHGGWTEKYGSNAGGSQH